MQVSPASCSSMHALMLVWRPASQRCRDAMCQRWQCWQSVRSGMLTVVLVGGGRGAQGRQSRCWA